MSDRRILPYPLLALVCAMTVALIGWSVLDLTDRGDRAKATFPPRAVVVVAGDPDVSGDAVVRRDALRPSSPLAHPTSSVRRTIADVTAEYPLLRNAALDCRGDRCALTGLILPPTDEAYLAKRQEMLVGGLAAMVSREGYTMEGPPLLDEFEDNTFRLHAALTRKP